MGLDGKEGMRWFNVIMERYESIVPLMIVGANMKGHRDCKVRSVIDVPEVVLSTAQFTAEHPNTWRNLVPDVERNMAKY